MLLCEIYLSLLLVPFQSSSVYLNEASNAVQDLKYNQLKVNHLPKYFYEIWVIMRLCVNITLTTSIPSPLSSYCWFNTNVSIFMDVAAISKSSRLLFLFSLPVFCFVLFPGENEENNWYAILACTHVYISVFYYFIWKSVDRFECLNIISTISKCDMEDRRQPHLGFFAFDV